MESQTPSPVTYVVILALSIFLSLVLTPFAKWLSHQTNAVAVPGGRRKHVGRIPRLGGISIFIPFIIGATLIFFLIPINERDAELITGVLIGAAVVFLGGILDDIYDFPWWAQYLVQVIATVIAFSFNVIFEAFTNPITSTVINLNNVVPFLVPIITLFWISGMMQTVNWLDGLDGLATGVSIIAAILFAWHSFQLEQYAIAAFPIALAGACIGFLFFNFTPAKIYLGSSGAFLLGYSIATLALIAPAKIATALLVMFIPILDVAWQIYNRIRKGRSPFTGDRGHLHFRLLDRGIRTRTIVLGYYGMSILLGLVAIFAPGMWKLVLLLVLSLVILSIFIWISNSEARQAREQDHSSGSSSSKAVR